MIYLLLASIGLATITAWMRRGKLSRLGDVTFRLWWVIPLMAILQSILIRLTHPPNRLEWWRLRPLMMTISYIILWAVVWLNRQLPGMTMVLVGTALNLLAIAANGGYMPISPDALARIAAGLTAYQVPLGNVVLGSKDVLLSPPQSLFWMLGDILVVPEPFPWPTAMSIGDLFLAVGIFLFIYPTMHSDHTDK